MSMNIDNYELPRLWETFENISHLPVVKYYSRAACMVNDRFVQSKQKPFSF